MLIEQIEHRWLAAFRRTLDLCALSAKEVVGIVTESQSRRVNVELAELAVQSLGATPVRIRVPSPALAAPAPVRSTGASDALQQLAPVVAALQRCHLVIDCTVEGLLHAPVMVWVAIATLGFIEQISQAAGTTAVLEVDDDEGANALGGVFAVPTHPTVVEPAHGHALGLRVARGPNEGDLGPVLRAHAPSPPGVSGRSRMRRRSRSNEARRSMSRA